MSQHGHIPPIAPAKDSQPQPERPKLRGSATRIGTSRKWVLPPRPKPGRKPKPKDKPIKVAPASSEDTDCGLCERDECLCQDIGLRNSPKNFTQSPSPQILAPISPAKSANEGKKDLKQASELGTEITLSSINNKGAVPLNRRPNPSAPKFMRASVEGMLSPMALKPTFKLKLASGEGCGFCTTNSPCVCAEQDQKEEQQAPVSIAPSAPPAISNTSSPSSQVKEEIDYGCAACQEDPMSMLFCLSLGASRPLPAGAVAIPCTMAYRTIVKHPKFAQCDLGHIMVKLESSNKMIGIQSVNRVLQYLNEI